MGCNQGTLILEVTEKSSQWKLAELNFGLNNRKDYSQRCLHRPDYDVGEVTTWFGVSSRALKIMCGVIAGGQVDPHSLKYRAQISHQLHCSSG